MAENPKAEVLVNKSPIELKSFYNKYFRLIAALMQGF